MKVEVDPWGSNLLDQDEIIRDFGLELLNAGEFEAASDQMKRGVFFGGRGLKIIADAIKNRKKFYALTGVQPSSEKLHLGNKLTVDNIKYFQERGAETFFVIADLESLATRGVSIEEARRRALNFHIPAYIALGLNPKKTVFYFQSENTTALKIAYECSKKITENEFKAIYGGNDPGKVMSALYQMGDIFYPQVREPAPTIIPCGVDQEPHIRLARDLAKRFKERGFFSPSSLYQKLLPSLNGQKKMSKSEPLGVINLPDGELKKKIMNALTGGGGNIEEQRRLGGNPDKCMIYELYKDHFLSDSELSEVYLNCRSGRLLCGEDKINALRVISDFMEEFKEKMEKARSVVDKIKFARD
jgi:tryptophanyl-tRNA synthetase